MGRSPWTTASTFALTSSRNPVITAIQFPYQYQCTYLSTDTKDHKETKVALNNPSLMIKAYLDLSKARLSSLVVVTTAAGFLAAGGPLTTMTAACTGTMLCSSSAAAFNQIIEVDRDSQMKRTQQRPMVQGTLSPTHATLVATAWGIAGTGILAVGTDPYTTALGVTNILLYAGLYTFMKPRTVWNTWVGAGTCGSSLESIVDAGSLPCTHKPNPLDSRWCHPSRHGLVSSNRW